MPAESRFVAMLGPEKDLEGSSALLGDPNLKIDPEEQLERQETMLDLIDDQCQQSPGRVAVVYEGLQLTYGQLNERSDRLAAHLLERGTTAESIVAVYLDRSPNLLVAILGILKAGGAYLPLDPEFPADRLTFMFQDSGATFLVTERGRTECFASGTSEPIYIDDVLNSMPQELGRKSVVSGRDLAYVLYTSGSTGRPKGVLIEHMALLNMLRSMADRPGLDRSDRLLALTTLSFDIAALELFLPLTVGACVVLAPSSSNRDPEQLIKLLADSRATVMQATPATWRMLLQAGWTGRSPLKILCGGERLERDLANELLARCDSLWNMYGPTETTVWSSVARVKPGGGTVPIGKPIANTDFYILDEAGELVSPGECGELCIGGDGLARGYLNRPQLTENRFIENPFGPSGSKLYRTGDEARTLESGEYECLGRKDDQVKIHGFRIEPGEIESALRQHPSVFDAVVLARKGRDGELRLAAFVVPSERNGRVEGSDLREHLRKTTPEYMVPGVFNFLKDLPLTPNGKVDRRALADIPDRAEVHERDDDAPRTYVERTLAEIFERVLGVRKIGIKTSFFAQGGHSLLAVRLFSEIARIWDSKLPPSTIFRAPTVELLAQLLEKEEAQHIWSSLVPIQTLGSLPPFFCVHPLGSNLVRYAELARKLGSDQPFYGFQSVFNGEEGSRELTVKEMAAEYIKAISTVQPKGPYNLGGWSFGGTVAFEMSQQLLAQGERISLLTLFDSFYISQPAHYPKLVSAFGSFWKLDRFVGDLLFQPGLRRVPRGWKLVKSAGLGLTRQTLKGLRASNKKDPMAELLSRIEQAHARAERAYVPKPYPGKLTLFWCSDWSFRAFHDTRLGWSNLAEDGLEVHVVPGNHKTLWEEPNVSVFAEKLKRCLERGARNPFGITDKIHNS